MTAYMLKIIAIISMVIDHSSFLFYGTDFSWMRCVGRFAFPIFAYQIAEGYIHTHSLKKYYIRLILFALISEIPYLWFSYTFIGSFSINIIFTLILGLFCINIYDFFKKHSEKSINNSKSFYKYIAIFLILFLSILAEMFELDYGCFGVLLIFCFYVFHDNKFLMNFFSILLIIMLFLPHLINSGFHIYYIIFTICTLVPLIFINLSNGKKGKNSKWLFYIFYPVHLTLICLIYFLIK